MWGGQHLIPSDPCIPVGASALQELGWPPSPTTSGSQEGLSVGGRACVRCGLCKRGAPLLQVRCASIPVEWQVIAGCQFEARDEGRVASGPAPMFLLLLHTFWWHPLCRLGR